MEQFHVFSRGCRDVNVLLHAFRHYREVILRALRLRRTEAGDVLEADILLINLSWALEHCCATHHEYWRYLPDLTMIRRTDGSLVEPKAGDGIATYAVWTSTEKRSGVVIARDVHKNGAAHFWEEVENKVQGGVRYKQLSIGNMYKAPAINGKPPFRTILSAPITIILNAFSDPVQQPILECIGVLNITHPTAVGFTNEDCSWAQGCASLIGSLHASLYSRLTELTPDVTAGRHPNEVVLEMRRSRTPEPQPVASTPTTEWSKDIGHYKGKVDAFIITIIPEEFEAVRNRFQLSGTVSGKREYNLCRVSSARSDKQFLVAASRQIEPGNGESSKITHDAIFDLEPRSILVVGIAGAVPVSDATLGDVIFGNQVDDFRLHKIGKDGKRSFDVRGGPVNMGVTVLLANLAMHLPELVARLKLPKYPKIPFDGEIAASDDTAKSIRARLRERYTALPLIPKWHDGPIASSDSLVAFSELSDQWTSEHRKILAVEMESAGACQAARQRRGTSYPVVPIRAVSDVIGLKRDDEWKTYAADIAAAYALAFIQSWEEPPT